MEAETWRIDVPVLTERERSLVPRADDFSKAVIGPLFVAKAERDRGRLVRDGVTPLGWSPAGDALVAARPRVARVLRGRTDAV